MSALTIMGNVFTRNKRIATQYVLVLLGAAVLAVLFLLMQDVAEYNQQALPLSSAAKANFPVGVAVKEFKLSLFLSHNFPYLGVALTLYYLAILILPGFKKVYKFTMATGLLAGAIFLFLSMTGGFGPGTIIQVIIGFAGFITYFYYAFDEEAYLEKPKTPDEKAAAKSAVKKASAKTAGSS